MDRYRGPFNSTIVSDVEHITSKDQQKDVSYESTPWKALSPAIIMAALIPIICLLPFVGKAFHLDDTVYIWVARQIRDHPVDFFGFEATWGGYKAFMYDNNLNPPGVSYYIAAVVALFGEREIPLHLAMVIPASATAVGTYLLARRFCSRPLLATICCVVTPAFLVSSSNVMSDTMMLAFYVWAAVLWMRGLDLSSNSLLITSAILMAMSTLTKYFGITIIPLMLVYTIMRTKRMGSWLPILGISIIIIFAYEIYTGIIYGSGHIINAASYASQPMYHSGLSGSTLTRILIGFSFLGGSLIVLLFFAPFLIDSVRSSLALVVGTLLGMALLISIDIETHKAVYVNNKPNWSYLIQFFLYSISGVVVIKLCVEDLWRSRDSASVFLGLSVIGTFIFSTVFNWSVNARSILPMAPAVGILIARRLDQRWCPRTQPECWELRWQTIGPLVPTLTIGLCLLWADYTWAGSQRAAVKQLQAEFSKNTTPSPSTIYYAGHWGFQYYMDKSREMPEFDTRSIYAATSVNRGDRLIIPNNNSNPVSVPTDLAIQVKRLNLPACSWVCLMHYKVGAGFYSSMYGRLPYLFGSGPSENYDVFVVSQPSKLLPPVRQNS